MSIVTDESKPLLMGAAIVVIILIAMFSAGGEKEDKQSSSSSTKKKEGKKQESLASSATASKKSKKPKKSSGASKQSAALAAEKKKEAKTVEETPAPALAAEEPATSAASKKKKKKAKKISNASSSNAASNAGDSQAASSSKPSVTFSGDGDDSDSDDDVDLWVLQSAAKRKGANDAAKRAAANKEKERERRVQAAKKQEEEKAAAEKARKEKEEAEAAALAAAAAEEEAKKKAVKEAQEKAKKNGATVANGGSAGDADATGDKKKRKRKKKKVVDDEPATVKKTPAPVEHWETVPVVEEWQEVGSKKAKQKVKLEVNAAAIEDAAEIIATEGGGDGEAAESSVSISAGDDPYIFIGKGGSTIQNLQASTGAKFDLNRTTNVLTISGPEECVQQGLAEARAILASEAERKANENTEKVTWGADAIKAVIGKGGSNIRATQDATGVKIDADVDAGTLVIVGPREQVSAALTMCHNAAFGEAQDSLELGSRNAVNVVYGPNFQTIRELQDSTGCKLDIARGSTTLKLSGSNEAVSDAMARVRALLNANRGFDMTIDNSKVGAVYGKGGATLRSIQDRTGVQIDVERGPTHATVSVMGTPEASERARHMLQRAIDGEVELGPGEVAEDIELGSATAAVIGRGGSNVVDLEKRHGVKVNVRSELQVARIVGRPEKVAAATKDIEAIVKPILDAEKAQKKADEAVQSGESAWQVTPEDDDADGW
mmetsp:Transcript_30538/g.62326  ORF Transcript_30538/g.62326 Transcript_30538/m.62326 type:complete len:719 (-) Transcript_30538:277-2433(-)